MVSLCVCVRETEIKDTNIATNKCFCYSTLYRSPSGHLQTRDSNGCRNRINSIVAGNERERKIREDPKISKILSALLTRDWMPTHLRAAGLWRPWPYPWTSFRTHNNPLAPQPLFLLPQPGLPGCRGAGLIVPGIRLLSSSIQHKLERDSLNPTA